MNENSINCIFVIDESGSLGYSRNQEKFEGEFGLVAGYFLPFRTIQEATTKAKPLFAEFRKNDDEKIHITDLSEDEQDKLRNRVFEIFISDDLVWLYDAISVQGMYEFYKNDDSSKKEKIHTKLFYSIILKALALVKTCNKTVRKVNMLIVSDKLNKGEIKDFEREIRTNHYLLTDRQKEEYFNKKNLETGEIEKFVLKTKVEMPESDNFQFDELTFDIHTDVSDVTLIADVLANSAFYYIKQKVKENPNIQLNSKEAIKQHPLADRVWGNQIESMLDIMYSRER